jgi:hypothetical protein
MQSFGGQGFMVALPKIFDVETGEGRRYEPPFVAGDGHSSRVGRIEFRAFYEAGRVAAVS